MLVHERLVRERSTCQAMRSSCFDVALPEQQGGKRMLNVWRFDLVAAGESPDPVNGNCVMSAVSWFTDGTLSDHPPCACPVLAACCRVVNDGSQEEHRQKLKVFIPRLAEVYGYPFVARKL
jgi:hypothetical protein